MFELLSFRIPFEGFRKEQVGTPVFVCFFGGGGGDESNANQWKCAFVVQKNPPGGDNHSC